LAKLNVINAINAADIDTAVDETILGLVLGGRVLGIEQVVYVWLTKNISVNDVAFGVLKNCIDRSLLAEIEFMGPNFDRVIKVQIQAIGEVKAVQDTKQY